MKTKLTYQLQVPHPMALISIGPALTFPTFTPFVPKASTMNLFNNNPWNSIARNDRERDETISHLIFLSDLHVFPKCTFVVGLSLEFIFTEKLMHALFFKNMTHRNDGCFDVCKKTDTVFLRKSFYKFVPLLLLT